MDALWYDCTTIFVFLGSFFPKIACLERIQLHIVLFGRSQADLCLLTVAYLMRRVASAGELTVWDRTRDGELLRVLDEDFCKNRLWGPEDYPGFDFMEAHFAWSPSISSEASPWILSYLGTEDGSAWIAKEKDLLLFGVADACRESVKAMQQCLLGFRRPAWILVRGFGCKKEAFDLLQRRNPFLMDTVFLKENAESAALRERIGYGLWQMEDAERERFFYGPELTGIRRGARWMVREILAEEMVKHCEEKERRREWG